MALMLRTYQSSFHCRHVIRKRNRDAWICLTLLTVVPITWCSSLVSRISRTHYLLSCRLYKDLNTTYTESKVMHDEQISKVMHAEQISKVMHA